MNWCFWFFRFLNNTSLIELFDYLLIIVVSLFVNKWLDSFEHSHHRFRFLKLYSHQLIIFVKEIKCSLTTLIESDINVPELVSTSFVVSIKINVTIIVFYESICPRLEKSFSSYQTLFIDGNFFIEQGLNNRCKYNLQSLWGDIFEILNFHLILQGKILFNLCLFTIDHFGNKIEFPFNFFG